MYTIPIFIDFSGYRVLNSVVLQNRLSNCWGFNQQEIFKEPILVNASYHDAYKYGGPITRTFLDCIITSSIETSNEDIGCNEDEFEDLMMDYTVSAFSKYLRLDERIIHDTLSTFNAAHVLRWAEKYNHKTDWCKEWMNCTGDAFAVIGPAPLLGYIQKPHALSFSLTIGDSQDMDKVIVGELTKLQMKNAIGTVEPGYVLICPQPIVPFFTKCTVSGYYYFVHLCKK